MNSKRTFRSISVVCLLALASLVAVPLASSQASAADSDSPTTAKPEPETNSGNKAGSKAPARISRVRVVSKTKRVRHGSRVKVRGVVERRSKRVGILFRPRSSKRWYRLKKVETDKAGRYATSVRARRNGQVKAVSSVGTASRPQKIRVRSRISLKRVRKFTPVGSRVLIRGAVSPAGKRRVKVVIGGSSGKVIRTRTTSKGGFKVSWRPDRTGSYRVRVFASRNGDAASDSSRRIRVTGLRQVHASYYGPGLYGGALACGGRLYPGTRGVAHKTLPCGSKITLRYQGRTVTTRVIDRGPYIAGRELDLTEATRNDLGFGDIGSVWTSR